MAAGSNWQVDDIDFGSPEQVNGLMKSFARALLFSPDDTYTAACKVFPYDPGKAMYVSRKWPLEQAVKDFCTELLTEHGALHFLPNKADIGREVIKLARESKSESQKLASLRFYAELMDMLPAKSSPGSTTNTNLFLGANKVMQVAHFGDNEQYERACLDQQQKLLAEAAEDLND